MSYCWVTRFFFPLSMKAFLHNFDWQEKKRWGRSPACRLRPGKVRRRAPVSRHNNTYGYSDSNRMMLHWSTRMGGDTRRSWVQEPSSSVSRKKESENPTDPTFIFIWNSRLFLQDRSLPLGFECWRSSYRQLLSS